MELRTEPCIGVWYAGERGTGTFLVTDRDAASGLVHLRSADGRRVRMTLEKWSSKPLSPAQNVPGFERFEWYEPAIG